MGGWGGGGVAFAMVYVGLPEVLQDSLHGLQQHPFHGPALSCHDLGGVFQPLIASWACFE